MIFLELFWSFLRMGLFNFGGGYAMISLMEQEVLGHGWISTGEFADMVAVSQMTPGPLAVNLATYTGFRTAGFAGAIVATLGVFLPSLVICVVVASIISKFNHSRPVQAVFSGIKPAVLALISMAFLFMAGLSVFNGPLPLGGLVQGDVTGWSAMGVSVPGLLICLGVVLAHLMFKVDALILVVLSGLAGFLFMY